MASKTRKWHVAWTYWDPPVIQRYLDEGWEPYAATVGHGDRQVVHFRRKAKK
jgi:hypothetical protein